MAGLSTDINGRFFSRNGSEDYLASAAEALAQLGSGQEGGEAATGPLDVAPLLSPLRVGPLALRNRLVMSSMTRKFSPGGVPGLAVADYYKRRARGGVGLVITEGTYVPQAGAGFSADVPRFYGADALEGWQQVVKAVQAEGSRIMPQLWHVGLVALPGDVIDPARVVSPSGLTSTGEQAAPPATKAQIEASIVAFGDAAANAKAIGCDGIQIHGAHGYLLDQFFWGVTNRRTDAYGGDTLAERTRFAFEVVRECRLRTAPDFPIMFRFSQWRQQDFTACLAANPAELEAFLLPLADAGVDIFDPSTRRFWQPAFEGSDLGLSGWTRKLTGKTTATVGSITLDTDLFSGFLTETSVIDNLDRLLQMMERGDFDLACIGRALIADPDWAHKIAGGRTSELACYDAALLDRLD